MVHPILDEYYNENPYHSRSSKFVENKGLVTNEKATTPPVPTPTHIPSSLSFRPSNLHDSLASTLTPSMHASISPILSPYSESTLANIQNVARNPSKTTELGNTKKKRRSLSADFQAQANSPPAAPEPEVRAAAYGDPLKIAQYFPELN